MNDSVAAFNASSHAAGEPPQLPLRHCSRLRRHQVAQTVRGIVAANTILIGVHFEHILRPIRIVLQRRQALNEAGTPRMNEQPCRHVIRWIPEPVQHFSPTAHTFRVRDLQADTKLRVLQGHR